MSQFDNFLQAHEVFAHTLNPSHICDWPEEEVKEPLTPEQPPKEDPDPSETEDSKEETPKEETPAKQAAKTKATVKK